MQAKAQEEIDSIVGDEAVTDEHLSSLVYLRNIVFETLRLRGPAFTFDRKSTVDVELAGQHIPKGTSLCVGDQPAGVLRPSSHMVP
jgi:epi-isozizaene 5-monooxygenase